MSKPSRRKPAGKPFPKPKWPPIQDLDSIDIIGKRKDGGVDLVIVASQPLDDAPKTLLSILKKVRTYLEAIDSEEFLEEVGHPPRKKIAILLACDHPIHPAAEAVIEECRAAAAARGVRLEVEKSPG